MKECPAHRCTQLVQETPEQRRAIIDAIRINQQQIGVTDWLQVDHPVDIYVPRGFRGIVYPDSHSPYEHHGVLRAIFEFAYLWQPHLAIDEGDFLDFARLSRFLANVKEGYPRSQAFEVESAKRQLRFKSRAGNPEKLLIIPGNHDTREGSILSSEAFKFGGFINGGNRNMITDLATNILGFTARDPVMFCWGPGQKGGRDGGIFICDVRFRHGNLLNVKPGGSAYRHWQRQANNDYIGHTHDCGNWAQENKLGKVNHGGEFGNTIDELSPGFNYMATDQHGTHAFGVLNARDGILHVQPVPMLRGMDPDGNIFEYFTWLDVNGNVVVFIVRDC
jgi:hypothetical protein